VVGTDPQGGIFSAPAYFNGAVYFGALRDNLRMFPITNAKLSTTPSSLTPSKFGYPGTSPSVSANGSSNAIVWAVDSLNVNAAGDVQGGVLHAYDASNLTNELYNSSQAGTRDQYGPGGKFTPPTIANGKVFLVTQVNLTNNPSQLQNGVVVFGLLGP
jgi:hypothetical protein